MATLMHYHFHFSTPESDIDLSSIDPFLLDPNDLDRSRKLSMVDNSNLFNIPLSPPTSPRMSGYQPDQQDSWQDQKDATESTEALPLNPQEMPNLTLDTKPMLRSHKPFPYSLSSAHQPDTPPLNSSDGSPNTNDDLTGLGDIPTNEIPQVHFGSAPNSPLSSIPGSPKDDDDLDGDGLGINLDGDDDNKKPMSAAEIRAQKRKMKRFRLTHNQTRFLMSEFARQAHPDAAHRERLAREIPGLTPRQVQVWFQNRRAKLKRLTSDDRERMMRSRALPDDFDMTQALHSPFGAIQNVSSTLSSPGGFSTIGDGNLIRPLSLDTLRRVPDGSHMSPIPGYGGGFFTPPQSVTDGLSPVSPADSPFTTYSPTLDGSQRRGNPFVAGSLNSPSSFTSHPQIPRLPMQDRNPRSQADNLNSPLRPNMQYGGDMSAPSSPLPQDSGSPQMMGYGLGYSYPQTVSGFAATANGRMRPFSNIPRRIDVGPTSAGSPTVSRPGFSPTTRTDGSPQQQNQQPHSAGYSNYASSPMVSASSGFNMLSAPHHMSTFQNSYVRQDLSPTHESYGNDLDDGGDGQDNEITAF